MIIIMTTIKLCSLSSSISHFSWAMSHGHHIFLPFLAIWCLKFRDWDLNPTSNKNELHPQLCQSGLVDYYKWLFFLEVNINLIQDFGILLFLKLNASHVQIYFCLLLDIWNFFILMLLWITQKNAYLCLRYCITVMHNTLTILDVKMLLRLMGTFATRKRCNARI